jgi:hypothetical protein
MRSETKREKEFKLSQVWNDQSEFL